MKVFPLVLVLLIVGCSQKVWVKEGATYKSFGRDKALCLEKSQVGPKTASTKPTEATADPEKYSACMVELGYTLEYDRPLNPKRFWRRD